MEDDIDIQDPEETLSLSDFQQATDEAESEEFRNFEDRRSSSEPTEFFEFFSNLSFDMSHADDIIFCGKLIPLNQKPISNQTHNKPQIFHPRRSESLSESKTSRSNSTITRLRRNSRSLDYSKLGRNSSMSSETAEIQPNLSGFKVPKPRWYVMMFGLVKLPPEMDLRDIKDRQIRREASAKIPVNRSGRKSSWRLLRVLSCKDHACVAATASFGSMQYV